MANKKLTLEQLKRHRDQLLKDQKEIQQEEKVVRSACINPLETRLLNALTDQSKIPKFSRDLLKAQNKKKAVEETIDETKLLNLYRMFTGVTIENISVESINLSEDPVDKCLYKYDVNIIIENLQCNISYQSNKPPDDHSQTNEIMKHLTFTIPTLQKEIQKGLNFFSQHPKYFPNAILFLRSVNKLNIIRKNICKDLYITYKNYVSATTAVSENNRLVRLICKGISRPEENITFDWQIKWDLITYFARDSFAIILNLTDKDILFETKPVLDQICNHAQWSKLEEENKLRLFKSLVNFIIEADTKQNHSDANVSTSEYSSIVYNNN